MGRVIPLSFFLSAAYVPRAYRNWPSVLARQLGIRPYPVVGLLRDGNDVRIVSSRAASFDLLPRHRRVDPAGVSFSFRGRQVTLHGAANLGDVWGVFVRQEYKWLPVQDRTVIDVGASLGESSIYFSLKGATKVLAFEKDPESYAFMLRNLTENKISNVTPVQKEILELNFAQELGHDLALKLDCEGGEYGILGSTSPGLLRRFSNVLLEYHYGLANLPALLRRAGFHTAYTRPCSVSNGMRTGLMWATRIPG